MTAMGTKEKRFWLAYDLGIDGPYDDLYVWLDKIAAVDCGDGLCSFKLTVKHGAAADAVLREIKGAHVKLRPKDRLYLISRREDGAMSGAFIHGGRRRAPWTGCYVQGGEEESDNA